MSSLYSPPDHESEHLNHSFDSADSPTTDRLWKGFVVGLLAHLIQPALWWLTQAGQVRLSANNIAFTQVIYLLPLSFVVYKYWGRKAFKGVYLLLTLTLFVNVAVLFGINLYKQWGSIFR